MEETRNTLTNVDTRQERDVPSNETSQHTELAQILSERTCDGKLPNPILILNDFPDNVIRDVFSTFGKNVVLIEKIGRFKSVTTE